MPFFSQSWKHGPLSIQRPIFKSRRRTVHFYIHLFNHNLSNTLYRLKSPYISLKSLLTLSLMEATWPSHPCCIPCCLWSIHVALWICSLLNDWTLCLLSFVVWYCELVITSHISLLDSTLALILYSSLSYDYFFEASYSLFVL